MANKDRVNVANGLSDILGNVIQSDRRRSGRSEEQAQPAPAPSALIPSAADTMTSVIEISEADNKTLRQYDDNTLRQAGHMADPTAVAPAKRRQQAPQLGTLDNLSPLELRVEEAKHLADSPTTTVTLRIPHALNNWLDEYVHGSWPDKVKKQQLVTEALQLLYARRGKPKEDIMSTELFPDTH